jgi:hypothetical protein
VQACRKEDRFFLILDEADDYQRSAIDGPQTQIEQAHTELWVEGRPLIVAAVTATMLPLFTSEMYESVTGEDVFITKQDDYSGVLDMVPFKDRDGHMIVIPPNALVPKNLFMCPELTRFYEAAAKTPKALLLDVISPRVTAEGNNVVRSKKIQELFPHVCFVVVDGSNSRVLRPGHVNFDEPRKLTDVKIGDVLDELDKEMPLAPIFVLGYSKMERSISYRTSMRIPTHMSVNIGGTLAFERLIQTLGRGTGRHFPAGHKVVVLSNGLDFDAARAYVRFQSKLVEKMKEDEDITVADIIDEHTFKDEENFWAFNVRSVAQKRAARSWRFKIKREPFQRHGPHREGFRAVLDWWRTQADVDAEVILWCEVLVDIFRDDYPEDKLTLDELVIAVRERVEDDDDTCGAKLLNRALAALVKTKLVVKSGVKRWMWNDVCGREW